jgi:hypothetical protein
LAFSNIAATSKQLASKILTSTNMLGSSLNLCKIKRDILVLKETGYFLNSLLSMSEDYEKPSILQYDILRFISESLSSSDLDVVLNGVKCLNELYSFIERNSCDGRIDALVVSLNEDIENYGIIRKLENLANQSKNNKITYFAYSLIKRICKPENIMDCDI